MFYKSLCHYIVNASEEYDNLARITQHPLRPKPNRDIDQIFMLPGSQLNQAKLISPYLRDKQVVFMGDGDAMALSIGLLAKEGVIEGPRRMLVLDFDRRLVDFVNNTAVQFGIQDRVEAQHYNAANPVPESLRARYDIFYTNPPYGSKNEGKSGIGFLMRCIALCGSARGSGIAILPYNNNTWSSTAMYAIQEYMSGQGYVVGDMLREMHSYHLDDLPMLRSATVVFDRVRLCEPPLLNESLPPEIVNYFYGSENIAIPRAVGLDGQLEY